MSRDVESAHYLHDVERLSLVFKPPVRGATHMVWDDTGHLVVSKRDGTVDRVHPTLGTRTVLQRRLPTVGLGAHDDRFVLVEQGGRWGVYGPRGEIVAVGAHPFDGDVGVLRAGELVVLTGHVDGERQALFYEKGRKKLRVRLPESGVAFVKDGRLGLARATVDGLQTLWLEDGGRFESAQEIPHPLVPGPSAMLGRAGDGVVAWPLDGGTPKLVELDGTTAGALSDDGRWAALGTDEGELAVVDLTDDVDIEEFEILDLGDGEVRAIAFSHDGLFLAVSAEAMSVWSVAG